MSYNYSWTITSNYHYDATLTQSLLNDYIADQQDSSGRDSHIYNLNWGSRTMGGPNLYHWPANWEKQHDTSYHESTTTDEPMDPTPINVTYEFYENFTEISGVDFTVASGLTDDWGRSLIPSSWAMGDNTKISDTTFGNPATVVTAAGSGATLSNINFAGNSGSVCLGGTSSREEEYVVSHTNTGDVMGTRTVNYTIGGQSLNTMSAAEDFDTLVVLEGASATVNNVTVDRKMRNLFIAGGSDYYNVNSSLNGSGTVVSGVTVHGALSSAYVGNGAVLNGLIVGNYRRWGADSHASAFLGEDVWGSTSHMSAINMTVASGGTANNIYLGFGGSVTVLGPEDRVSSSYNSETQQWEVTTAYASGTGGVLTNLQMATSGGLILEGGGNDMQQKLWSKPSNGYANSSSYKSGFIAGAPQSAYVQFDSNTSGNNINIGNGGSMTINSGASVVGISMGGLLSSITVVNSSGGTDTWIGDRGAKLTIDGGYASNVTLDPVMQSFDYYSASHDYFWLYSSSLMDAYSSTHGSYGSDAAWSSSIYNSAVSGYRQYMSAQYTSGGHNTHEGDDTNGYTRQYVGGEVLVNGGQILNVSGFSYLQATATVDVTVSNHVSSWEARQWTYGHVSKAVGAVSATLEVAGGGHVSNVKIEGGRVIMTAGGNVNARWEGQEIKQSNFNLVEDLDLRTAELVGDNHSAVIEFHGSGTGGWSEYVSSGYVDYFYDAMDPGEIHYLTADSGLVVKDLGWGGQNFTYTGSGAVTINGLGTVWTDEAGSRCYYSSGYYSSSSDGTSKYVSSISRWLTPSSRRYEFGVVKGVYDEANGRLQAATILNGDGGFDWLGTLVVGSGGIVQDIGSGAGLKTANTLTSDSWNPVIENEVSKKLVLVAGGSADNVAVTGKVTNYERTSQYLYQSNAALVVSSGGTATNISVLSNGIAMAVGGTIDGAFVGSGGILYLSGWAGALQISSDSGNTIAGAQYLDETVLNNVHLDKGGQLAAVYEYQFGGKAPSIIANTGAGILNGVTANGVAYMSGVDFAGGVNLGAGQQAVDVTVRGFTDVTSTDSNGNPTAWTTTIAYMNVSSGGIVSGATVGEDGAIYVSDGAAVSGLTASGGRLIFGNSSGWSDYFPGSATVSGITVMDGGILEVNSKFALKATDMQIKESAGLEVNIAKNADENHAVTELNGTWTASWGSGTFHTNNGVLSGFGGQFGFEYTDPIYGSKYTSARLSMTFLNNATLLDGDMRGFGYFSVRDGAKVLNTKLKGITANIGGGGYASGLFAMTDPTNSAYQTNIYVYGNSQKGTVGFAEQTVMSGGYMMVEDGGKADGVTMLAPEGYEGPAGDSKKVGPVELEITAGGSASNVVASAGVVTIAEGSKDPGTGPSTLSNAEIHSSAMLLVNADGVVLDGALKLAGTVVTTAERYKYVEVEVTDPDTGDTYTDWQRVTLNNAVADAKTLTVSFDLTERDGTETVAMIDNLANLQGATLGTITVASDQASGSYILAQGAESFNGTLTIKRDGDQDRTISVGDMLQVQETVYKLSNTTDAGLVFSLMSTDAAVTDILATVDGQPLQKGTWVNQPVNIKVEVNQYSKSIWYRVRKAVGLRGYDEWLELDNTVGVDITEYCEVDFKAVSENGVDSKIVTYTVNYDATPAAISDLRIDSGEAVLPVGANTTLSFLVEDELDNAPKVEVSIENGDWAVVNPTAGGRYAFSVTGGISALVLRTTDHAGNVSTTSMSSVAAPTANADVLTPTNQDVTVTAIFDDSATTREYSLDGQTWETYTDSVVLADNATVYFRAGNLLGYSEVTTCEVTNIDKVAPDAPTASADVATPTNGNVTITATFSADSTLKEYSTDGQIWSAYTEPIALSENGTVSFCGTDAAGNVSEVTSYEVTNIDKVAPDAPTASADVATPTNGNVTVTATFSDDSTLKEYSLDGQTWEAYTAPVVLIDNGTVSFRGTDAAGNVSEVTTYEVTNIDKVAPDAPTTSADITAPTNGFVTVTATFSGDSVTMQVSLDGTDWYNYSQPIVMTANGWVYFRGIDAAGNVSEVTGYEVTNIDITAPNAPTALADITAPTNGNVTVTAIFSDDCTLKEYSLDGQTWNAYTQGIVLSDNGTVSFRGTDAAGNVSDVTTYEVSNIDKVAPTAPTVSADVTDPTNQNVTVSAVFSDDSTTKEYSLDGQTWNAYTDGVVLSDNGTVSFRATDAAGNVSDIAIYEVTNIDKAAPTAPTASADITDPTNGDVTVTAVFSDDSAVKEYSLDGQTWSAYTEPVALSDNGTVSFRGTDAAGNVSDVTTCEVTNIDKVAPTAPTASADITDPTNQAVTVSAVFSDDSAIKEYSLDGQTWSAYTQGIVLSDNGTVSFRGTDAAGNVSDVTTCEVTNIDKVAPTAPTASADITDPTNGDVTVSAVFSDDSVVKEYSLDGQTWSAYTTGIILSDNGTVSFRGTDAAGNVSDVAIYEVTNIDKAAPTAPTFALEGDEAAKEIVVTATWDEADAECLYSLDGQTWSAYTQPLRFSQDATVQFKTVDAAGNESTVGECPVKMTIAAEDISLEPSGDGSEVVATWASDDLAAWTDSYDVQVTIGDSGTVLLNGVSEQGIEVCNAPDGSLEVVAKPSQTTSWPEQGKTTEVASGDALPRLVAAESNGYMDVMFGRTTGVWNGNYRATNMNLPSERAKLKGKNQIGDLFFGSDDASLLLLTDDANGDVFFLDDIYSAFPDGLDAQARLAKIDEIQAGAGADVVDLTSTRFEYVGGGLTVHGGDGDDVIWANSGDNLLFGDGGNDRIVGAVGNDVIVGGAGDDTMHGGGGGDIFAFGGDWGKDTVEQLATGKVTLWFKEGDQSKWDVSTLTYADGANSVKVSGVDTADVSLKFGDDGSQQYQSLLAIGAFDLSVSERIFEDKNRGMLA